MPNHPPTPLATSPATSPATISRRLGLAASVVLASTALSSGSSAGALVASDSSSTSSTYRASDSGTTVRLASGDTIKVKLKGHPSTGYTWKAPKGAGGDVFEILSRSERSPDQRETPMPGAASVVVYKIKAIGAGTATFKAVERRSFGKKRVADRFSLKLKVR